jgi:hypothetical protein
MRFLAVMAATLALHVLTRSHDSIVRVVVKMGIPSDCPGAG